MGNPKKHNSFIVRFPPMPMNLYDYLMLKEQKQISTLIDKGRHVMTLDNGATFFQLYSLSIFFVELEYEKWTNRLVGRAIFQSGTDLDKYISAR